MSGKKVFRNMNYSPEQQFKLSTFLFMTIVMKVTMLCKLCDAIKLFGLLWPRGVLRILVETVIFTNIPSLSRQTCDIEN